MSDSEHILIKAVIVSDIWTIFITNRISYNIENIHSCSLSQANEIYQWIMVFSLLRLVYR